MERIYRHLRRISRIVVGVAALGLAIPAASATTEHDADVLDTSRGAVFIAAGDKSLREILAEQFVSRHRLMPEIQEAVLMATPALRALSTGQPVPAGTRLFLPRIHRRIEVARLLHGQVQVTGDRSRSAATGQPLYDGEHITVAGRQIVRLRLADGSTMRLWPGTDLTLNSKKTNTDDTVQRLLAHLKSGRLHAETDRYQHHALEVHMPSVHLGVRGTDFAARVCRQGNCDEGAVEVGDSDLVGLLSGSLVADSATIDQFDIHPLQVWQLESDGSAPKQRPDLVSLLYGNEWPASETRCRRFPRVDLRPAPRVGCIQPAPVSATP